MAGAGAESTLESQKMCETMALAGADCFLIVRVRCDVKIKALKIAEPCRQ